jgi:hypothetical protein
MSEESPEEEPQGKEDDEKPTLDQQYVTNLRNRPKIAAVIAFGVVVLAVLSFANKIIEQGEKLWSRIHPPPTFDARVNLIFESRPLPLVFLVTDHGDFAACSAPVILNIMITNLQEYPATISDYTVEALDANDKWVKLPRIPMRKDLGIYVFTLQLGPEHAMEAHTDPPPLDTQLTATSILAPHVPLVGLAFFDDPLQYSFTQVRVTVRDTLNHQFTTGTLKPDVATVFPGVNFSVPTGHKIADLTKHPIHYHCGR